MLEREQQQRNTHGKVNAEKEGLQVGAASDRGVKRAEHRHVAVG